MVRVCDVYVTCGEGGRANLPRGKFREHLLTASEKVLCVQETCTLLADNGVSVAMGQ